MFKSYQIRLANVPPCDCMHLILLRYIKHVCVFSVIVQLNFGWLTSTYYLAPIKKKDIYNHPVTVTNTINNWVKGQTNNQITNLLDTLDRDVKLVLVNAISFKDKWVKPFGMASNGPFHVSNGATVQVCKMSMSCGPASLKYGNIPGVAAKILELPYKAHQVSMYIIRPNFIQGLSGVENSLTLAKLNSAISAMTTRNVAIVLPKFQLSKNMDLKNRLQALGMHKLFTYGAQLSGIGTGTYPLYVEFVQQKAVIKVDLKGTEASAATAVGVCPAPGRIRRSTTVPFDVDRPFLFVLRENSSGSILFMGRVTNPQSSCSGSAGRFDRVFRPHRFTSLRHVGRPAFSSRSGWALRTSASSTHRLKAWTKTLHKSYVLVVRCFVSF